MSWSRRWFLGGAAIAVLMVVIDMQRRDRVELLPGSPLDVPDPPDPRPLVIADPGGSYRAKVGEDTRPPKGTWLRARRSWFTSSMSATLEIGNEDDDIVILRPGNLRVVDSAGTALLYHAPIGCEETSGQAEVRIRRSDSCSITVHAQCAGVCPSEVHLVLDGVTKGRRLIPIDLALVRWLG